MEPAEQMMLEWGEAMAGAAKHPAVAPILASLRRLRAYGKPASEEAAEWWRDAAQARPFFLPDLLDAELACVGSMK